MLEEVNNPRFVDISDVDGGDPNMISVNLTTTVYIADDSYVPPTTTTIPVQVEYIVVDTTTTETAPTGEATVTTELEEVMDILAPQIVGESFGDCDLVTES